MKIVVCIDEKNGMMFNKRRQSRDMAVMADVIKCAGTVLIHPFSEKLFADYTGQVKIEETFLEHAKQGEVCFVENQKLLPYVDEIEEIWVYKWNRSYPADVYLDLDLNAWNLVEQVDFEGNSHEKITREIYSRGV